MKFSWESFCGAFIHLKQLNNAIIQSLYRIAVNFHGQIFLDFHELHRNHKNFCHEISLQHPLDTLKSRKLK